MKTIKSDFKEFLFDCFNLGIKSIVQNNRENAESILKQKIKNRKFRFLKAVDIVITEGSELVFIGKEMTSGSMFSFRYSEEFIKGKKYIVHRSGDTLYVVSEKGRQTEVNPKFFR